MSTPAYIYEILAKEVVNAYDSTDPNVVEAVNVFLTLNNYQIDQVFDDRKTGFQALGLKSLTSDKPPVLIFRGTSEVLDDFANADPKGVGYTQFFENKEAIGQWLNGKQADIIGHSLGGAITQIAAAEFTNLVNEIVTFNSPGTTQAIADQFLQNGGANKSVTHYIVSGDYVSLGGQAFIAGKAILQSYNDPAINPSIILDKHIEIRRLLSQPPAGYSQTEIPLSELNKPGFNYNNDSDYREFLAGYGFVKPTVAASLTSRAGVEALRTSPNFSFIGLVFEARDALAPDKANYLVGDDLDNTANGGGNKDKILGNGGNDSLKGGFGADFINGGTGADTLFGDAGADILIGGKGADVLVGGAGSDSLFGNQGSDTLNGVNPNSATAGRGEVDTLFGGLGIDLFTLGNGDRAFYNDGKKNFVGNKDYALIADFRPGDVIQLHGAASDYTLKTGFSSTAVYLKTSGKDELIGIVQGVSNLNLSSSAFTYA